MNHKNTALKRSITLPMLTLYGLGSILGAGIYVLIGEVAALAGPYTPIAFLVAALMALFTAFSYAELSSRYPRSAGEALYVQEAFAKPRLSLLVGGLVTLIGIVSSATLLRGFVGYAQLHLQWSTAALLLVTALVLTLVALWGIRQSMWLATLVTLIELSGLVLIISVSGDSLSHLSTHLSQLNPGTEVDAWSGVLLGAVLAFYAFIGFEDMVNVAEEVRHPRRTLPQAIILALLLATLLYMLVSLVAVVAVPAQELAGREAPLAWLYQQTTGRSPVLISYISMFAIINGVLVQLIMGSRVLYGLARQGWLPRALGRVWPQTRTPVLATLVVGLAILVFALWLPLLTLARVTSLLTLAVFSVVNLALLVIKYRQPRHEGHFSYPRWVPLLGMLVSVGFIVLQLGQSLIAQGR